MSKRNPSTFEHLLVVLCRSMLLELHTGYTDSVYAGTKRLLRGSSQRPGEGVGDGAKSADLVAMIAGVTGEGDTALSSFS